MVCVCACVRACVCACVRACVCACDPLQSLSLCCTVHTGEYSTTGRGEAVRDSFVFSQNVLSVGKFSLC